MSIFPTKILLATDSSEEATLAATSAAEIGSISGSELHVVHVEEFPRVPFPLSYEDAEMIQETEEADSEPRKMLDEQVSHIEDTGGRVTESYLRQGRPDREIVNLAEEIGAGLIVMGSRGLGGLRRTVLGSISDSVVRHAHCPVLVVRK